MGKTKATFSGLAILLVAFITYIALIGCTGGGGGGIQRTIAGTVTGGSTPKVSLFDDTYGFIDFPLL